MTWSSLVFPWFTSYPGWDRACGTTSALHATFKVKDGITLNAGLDAPHFSVHYTSEGSKEVNDMVLRTSSVVDEREERNPGVRTRYLTGDVPPDRAARISCTLGLPDGSGYVRLASADPGVQPSFNYRYLQNPHDMRRVREGLRFGISLLESAAYKDVVDHRITPTDDILADDDALDLWIKAKRGNRQARVRHLQDGTGLRPNDSGRSILPGQRNPRTLRGRRLSYAPNPQVRRHPPHSNHGRRTRRRLDCRGLGVVGGRTLVWWVRAC